MKGTIVTARLSFEEAGHALKQGFSVTCKRRRVSEEIRIGCPISCWLSDITSIKRPAYALIAPTLASPPFRRQPARCHKTHRQPQSRSATLQSCSRRGNCL